MHVASEHIEHPTKPVRVMAEGGRSLSAARHRPGQAATDREWPMASRIMEILRGPSLLRSCYKFSAMMLCRYSSSVNFSFPIYFFPVIAIHCPNFSQGPRKN
jgi:hypothetical protein